MKQEKTDRPDQFKSESLGLRNSEGEVSFLFRMEINQMRDEGFRSCMVVCCCRCLYHRCYGYIRVGLAKHMKNIRIWKNSCGFSLLFFFGEGVCVIWSCVLHRCSSLALVHIYFEVCRFSNHVLDHPLLLAYISLLVSIRPRSSTSILCISQSHDIQSVNFSATTIHSLYCSAEIRTVV